MRRKLNSGKSRRHFSALGTALVVLLGSPAFTHAQNWTKVASSPSGSPGLGTALLLTDGSVLVNQSCTPNWYKLVPDNTGNANTYINGTWSGAIPMQSTHGPLFFASAVLADGRAVAIGGEYNNSGSGCPANSNDTNLADIYNPATSTWSVLTPPPFSNVGDAPGIVLANQQFLLGNINSTAIAQLDPLTLTWTIPGVAGKADNNSEEGWTLLPNTNKFLTVDSGTQGGTGSEIYDPTAGTWSSAGSTIVSLPNNGGLGIVPEVGPAVLRPDGTVFAG